MADPAPEKSSSVEGEALLQSLGYNQELKRAINTLGNVALVLSDITPTASLLIIGTVVILLMVGVLSHAGHHSGTQTPATPSAVHEMTPPSQLIPAPPAEAPKPQ